MHHASQHAAPQTCPVLPAPTQDVLIGTLTVQETIHYSAKLRLPQVGAAQGKLFVPSLLTQMHL